jgi:hypothetical protein
MALPPYYIAKFDGISWQPLGNFDEFVFRVKTINSDLYAVGAFSTINGVPVHRAAKWNGTGWTDVNGFSADPTDCILRDIEIYNGNIYVCGNFVDLTLGINHLAVFKEGAWQNVERRGIRFYGGFTRIC